MSLRSEPTDHAAARHQVVEFGLLYAVLALFPILDLVLPDVAWRVERLVPDALPGSVLLGRTWFWVVVAMAVVAVGYALVRALPIRVGLPGRSDLGTVGVAACAPLILAGGLAVAVHVAGSSVGDVSAVAGFSNPSAGLLFWNAVVPGALVGVGYAFLFYGAILESLASALESRAAYLAVVVLAGLYHWYVDPVWRLPLTNVHLLVALVLVVGTTLAVVELSRLYPEASLREVLTPVPVVAVALAAAMAFVVATEVLAGSTSAGDVLLAGCWFTVFGLGAWAHDRRRSVWLPALAITVFQAAVLAMPSLELAWGLVGPAA